MALKQIGGRLELFFTNSCILETLSRLKIILKILHQKKKKYQLHLKKQKNLKKKKSKLMVKIKSRKRSTIGDS
jgi:hypothetical protein